MGRGKRYQPEQAVNLLQQIEVAVARSSRGEWQDDSAGVQGSGGLGVVVQVRQAAHRGGGVDTVPPMYGAPPRNPPPM